MNAIEKVKQAIRCSGKSATPYRIGVAVGEQQLGVACPYKPGTHGERLFKEGKQYGTDVWRGKP